MYVNYPKDIAPNAAALAGKLTSNTITISDGAVLFYKDWGSGPAVVFSHGYPLSSDAWENQMMFLLQHGFRVIAHDRRGFGRSSQPGQGYDYDTFAGDLAALIDALHLPDVTLVGHSMGCGEIARYIGRHCEKRVSKAVFVAAVTPFLLKTETHPNGASMEVFDGMRAALQADRSQYFRETTMPYYSYNRPGAHISEGARQNVWRQGMTTGILAAYYAITAFSEADFREDLAKITLPTLVVHGTDDRIVPIEISGHLMADIVKHARLEVYDGGSHGLLITQKARLSADLLAFLKS